MTARIHTLLLPLSLLLAVLAGCKVDSVHPISPAADAQSDPALFGVWRYREKDELTYVHIGPEFALGETGASAVQRRTRIVIVDHKPSGLTDEAYVGHVSRMGRQRYLNVVQTEDEKAVGYIFVRYALVDRNTLRLATINEDALQAAIRAGRIRGTIRGDGVASETAITAGTGEVGRFIEQEGEKLFGRPTVLKRVVKQQAKG